MIQRTSVLLCACVLFPACGAPGPEGQKSGPAASLENGAASDLVEKSSSLFTVALNDKQWTLLAPTSTHLCYISQFSGDFSDSEQCAPLTGGSNCFEGGGVAVTTDSGNWYGVGNNSKATCTAWSNFSSSTPGAVPLITDPPIGGALNGVYGSGSGSVSLWAGNAFSFITGIYGIMQGGGEKATITESTIPTSASTLTLQTQAGDGDVDLEAWAMSAFFGNPNVGSNFWQLANLVGISTEPDCGTVNPSNCIIIGNAFSTGIFEWNAVAKSDQQQSLTMVPTSQGFCAFTQISGEFDGYGEYVSITAQSGNWVLTARAGGGRAYAKARCMAYSQP